jgi:tetratricopeptide (TPR) repeat protein
MKRILVLTFAVAVVASGAVPLAQEHQHGDTAATSLGTVNFPTSCANEVQADFNRALALLYSFEYDSARDVFLAVAKKDPACAIAHWGAAMTHFHALWGEIDVDAGAREASLAREVADSNRRTTEREKQYIAAVSAIYAQKDATQLERAKAFADEMAHVHAANASDDEAAIFYALALDESAGRDPAYANQRKCGEILAPLFQKLPNHPGIAHYIIHCYDNDVLAAKGLSAARAYARIAPGSAHATHMPSHIFVRLSLWQETIDSNLASMKVAERAGPCRERGSLLHAMHFLQFAYLQVGRANEAKQVAERALSLPTGKDCDAGDYVAASYALEAHDWAMAKRVADRNSASSRSSDDIVVLLGVGVGAARTGDLTRALKAEQSLAEWRDARRKEAHSQQGFDGPRLIVAAWSAEARQDDTAALDLMRTAEEMGTVADRSSWVFPPTSEQFGDLLMQQNKPEKALVEYRKALAGTPDLFNALNGAARAAEAAGNQEQALGYYRRVTEVAGSGDRPEVNIAKKKIGGEQDPDQLLQLGGRSCGLVIPSLRADIDSIIKIRQLHDQVVPNGKAVISE